MTNTQLIKELKDCIAIHLNPYNLGDMGKTARLITDACERLQKCEQCNVSGLLPSDQRCKVQRIVNMAMLETGLSEDEVAGYMLYLLKGKEIDKRGGNDR